MSSRAAAVALARLLNSVSTPVCVLDEDRRLVFANEAYTEWAGVPFEDLSARIVAYAAIPGDGQTEAGNWICPPPQAFAGQRLTATIYAAPSPGDIKTCAAEFVPLEWSADGGVGPVLVVGQPSDATDPTTGETDQTVAPHPAALLHERLIRFRKEQTAQYRLDRLVGDSPAMQLVRTQTRAAIESAAGTTVIGPPGSPCEQIARTIHYGRLAHSQTEQTDARKNLLWPLDGSLLTAELLGSAVNGVSSLGRGASPTILLTHVDQLPLELHGDLVRQFVQRFNLRLLATSQTAPADLMREGRLHPQLHAAIGALAIVLPPLVQRRGDVPLLAQFLVEEINSEGGKQVQGCSAEALDALIANEWPGDVAELHQVIAEAFATTERAEITVNDLPQRIFHAAEAVRRPPQQPQTIDLADFLTTIERELIQRALKQSKGNKARAAKLLGLTRPRLYRRMVQLGLEQAAATDRPPKAARRKATGARRRLLPQVPAMDDRTDLQQPRPDEEVEFIEEIPFEEQAD